MNKKAIGIITLIILLLVLNGCSNQSVSSDDTNDSISEQLDQIEIKGLEEDTVYISLEEIMTLQSVERQMSNISSSGEIKELTVKGILLEDILSKYNTRQGNYNGIRFYAGDGYSIEVPKEILEKREIILYYESDGNPLDEKFLPLRIGVNDERAMYWVGNLMGMELISSEMSAINQVVLLEATYNQIGIEDYTYYESVDHAVKTQELAQTYSAESQAEQISIESVDGLEKNETVENFFTGYMKIDGADAPLFLSPDLPKGMHVKNVLYVTYGSTAYVSVNQTMEKYSNEIIEVNGSDGLSVKSIIDAAGMASDDVIAVNEDKEEITINNEQLGTAIIIPQGENNYSLHIDGEELNKVVYLKSK